MHSWLRCQEAMQPMKFAIGHQNLYARPETIAALALAR